MNERSLFMNHNLTGNPSTVGGYGIWNSSPVPVSRTTDRQASTGEAEQTSSNTDSKARNKPNLLNRFLNMDQTASTFTLDAGALQQARTIQNRDGRLDRFAVELGLNSAEEALRAVSATLGLQVVDPSSINLDLNCLEGFPAKIIHRHTIFPLCTEGEAVLVATSNPFDLQAIDAAGAALGKPVTPVVMFPDELAKLIKTHLGLGAETVEGLIALQTDQTGEVEMLEELTDDGSEAAEAAKQASVVRLVNEILTEAVEARASDVHVETHEGGIKLRYRIDGVLQKQPTPPEIDRFRNAIVSRLKILAKLNIAEKRVPQDGRIKLRVSGREVDVRVSVIPMLFGESIVMRILDKNKLEFSLRGIGMPEDIYKQFKQLISLPHGIVLVTGPTGSGKTTTLYSALAEIKSEDTKIITTEDPIEYHLDGINQIQVNHKVGLTFAASLRSILRHDPDVILVGEIRDLETAENATQASLTGHMVFSTLHTNDAAGAFMRLGDMGVEPFLVSSTLEGVLAQRLVRVLCKECREPYVPVHDEIPEDFPWEQYQNGGQPIYRAVGCRTCRNVGYRGRNGIYELLRVNDEIRRLANERATTLEIQKAAIRLGMKTLRLSGWERVLSGSTTIEEVIRVTKTDHS
jgi:general secretion pathway protein E/type IV pilus assembly protein PilB